MEDIGLEEKGVSPVAVSEPFPLFTEEAVMRFREEAFTKDVFDHCSRPSNLTACQLRGFAYKYSPFIYDAWKNPEVLRIISSIAGVDLVPAYDLEIGSINLSVRPLEEVEDDLRDQRESSDIDQDAIVGWHTDSFPFVCFVMLSDCTNMIGGETAMRTGTGNIIKVRGTQMGWRVVMQGRYIEHKALQALNSTERIAMATPFRPKSPFVRDDTILTSVRPISDLEELYTQFSEYRLEILEERIRAELKEIRERRMTGRGISTKKLKQFLEEQKLFLEHMNREMVDEDQVQLGWVDVKTMTKSALT
ncbi:hypothetical protein Daus18300_012804 [Diaporthe australafricana]|uniref:Fe2OG dioxygenase domain-containing protein n=1 Tax=Diaporthe australafricana TaxID=127596 RepID=A0ABR3W1F7_9PEZI